MTDPPPAFVFTLVAGDDPLAKAHGERFARDGGYRVRLLLKHALRRLGLRCVSVAPVHAAEPPPPAVTPPAAEIR